MLDRITQLQQENDRLQAELAQLRESEKRYRTLFELGSEGIVRFGYKQPIPLTRSIDEQLELCYRSIYVAEANDAYARMFEYEKVEDTIGLTLNDFHDRHSEITQATMRNWIENQYACHSTETVEFDRHGRKRYFLNSAASTIENGCVVCTWVSQVDITQLREAQQALLEAEKARVADLAKTNTALKNSLDRLAADPDLNAFLGHVALEAVSQLGADAGHLTIFNEQHETLSTAVHVQQDRIIPFSPLATEMAVGEVGAIQILMATRQPRFFDIEKEVHLFWAGAVEYHRQHNHRAVLAVPLYAGGKYLGNLGLAFTQTEPIGEQGAELIQALANQAALAIQLTRLAEEAKQAALAKLNEVIAKEQEKAATQRAAELAKANDALKRSVAHLTSTDSLQSFLVAVLQEAIQACDAVSAAVFVYNRLSHSLQNIALILHGEAIDIATDPRAEIWRSPVPADITDAWRVLSQERRFFWFNNDNPGVEHWSISIPWHQQFGHKNIATIPLLIGEQALGFLGLCFTTHQQPSESKLEQCWTLAQHAALALRMSQLAEEAKQAALAKLNEVIAKEQEKAAKEQAAELAKANDALARASSRLTDQPDLTAFLGHITQESVSHLGANAAHIMLFDEQREIFSTAVLVEKDRVVPASLLAAELPLEKVRLHSIMQGIRKLRYFDLETEKHLFWDGSLEYHRQQNHRSVIVVPLNAGSKFLGYFGLAFTCCEPICEQRTELLQALAHQAALAIQLTKLAEEAKQAAIACEREKAATQRAAQLAKANEALKRSLTMLALEPSLDKLLGYVLQAISDSLGDRSGAVYLFDDSDDTTTLHLNYENGHLQQGEQIDHPAATLRRPPQEWDRLYLPLLRQNQVLIHHESEFASPAYAPYRQHNAQRGIETLLFVPLLFGEQLLGSITLRSTQHRDYTLEELELARALAHQATLAIQLTRLAARECDRAILEERNRMARDIHDSLAQAFTGIILQLEAAKRKIAATQLEAAQNCLSRARSLAASGLSEARRSVRALRPEVLESDDLPNALRYIVEQMSWDTQVQIQLQIDGTPRPIPVNVEINLLRIGQEAMTNALRHANAQNIRLNLLFEPAAVHLQIRDDGQGFEPQMQLTNGGFGLIGMQERSRQIGGELRLVSSIGRGTEAIVTVPI